MPRSIPNNGESANIPKGMQVIHHVHELDGSGSMSYDNKFMTAVEGINADIKQVKADADKYPNVRDTVSIFQFSSDFKYDKYGNITMVPIEDFKDYKPKFINGSTRLYDSTIDIIKKMIALKRPEDKVLLKIFTDGQNNVGSCDPKPLARLIHKAEEKHNFTITFVGTTQDVAFILKNLGIRKDNTAAHDNTEKGVKDVYAKTMKATSMFRGATASGDSVIDHFYSKSY